MLPQRFGLVAAAFACACFLIPANRAEAQAPEKGRLVSALDSTAAAHAADSTVAGVTVAVVRRGDTLLYDGYGQADLELDVPTAPGGVYEIGSITKQFTAAAILKLAAKDSLDLDRPITEYLSDYDVRGHRVTVRHLLYHTSGLRDYTSLSEYRTLFNRSLSRDSVLALVEREPFRFAPGAAMSYSNSGYFLLGRIIEEVSGQSYASYLQSHLFRPAGMDDTYYCDERAVVDNRAQGYSWSRDGFRLRRRGNYHAWGIGAGALCSTAGDLVAWTRALHDGAVLSDSVYEEMVSPGRLADGTELRYGMGLALPEDEGHPAIGHFGGVSGFVSATLYYPGTEVTVVVLQNTWGPRTAWGLADELADLVLEPADDSEATPYEGDLSELVGRYEGPARGGELRTLEIRKRGGHLVASVAGTEAAATLRHVSGLTWRAPNRFRFGADRYRFVRAGQQIVELRQDVVTGHYVLRPIGEP